MTEPVIIVDTYTGEASPICPECKWVAWFIDRWTAARELGKHRRACHGHQTSSTLPVG